MNALLLISRTNPILTARQSINTNKLRGSPLPLILNISLLLISSTNPLLLNPIMNALLLISSTNPILTARQSVNTNKLRGSPLPLNSSVSSMTSIRVMKDRWDDSRLACELVGGGWGEWGGGRGLG